MDLLKESKKLQYLDNLEKEKITLSKFVSKLLIHF